jgi:hypothetical protein
MVNAMLNEISVITPFRWRSPAKGKTVCALNYATLNPFRCVLQAEILKTSPGLFAVKLLIEVQPFRNEGMPFGMANSKSQIPNMKSAIGNSER